MIDFTKLIKGKSGNGVVYEVCAVIQSIHDCIDVVVSVAGSDHEGITTYITTSLDNIITNFENVDIVKD